MRIKDISAAFPQSEPYPEGTLIHIYFQDPTHQPMNLLRAVGPYLGRAECSKRSKGWNYTIAPWSEKEYDLLKLVGGSVSRRDEAK